MVLIGNRIPYEYFITNGKGESDYGSEGLPYETGSYDEALTNAGIENTNIVIYTSIIPQIAKEISKEEGLKRVKWGEVMECIKAQTNGEKGKYISAAIMTTSVYSSDGNYIGGFACEYSGSGSKKEAEQSLEGSIEDIIERRNYGKIEGGAKLYVKNVTDKGYIIFPGKIFVYDGMRVKKHHGTVIACICFVSYKIPAYTRGATSHDTFITATRKQSGRKHSGRTSAAATRKHSGRTSAAATCKRSGRKHSGLKNKKRKAIINTKKNKYYYI